MNDDSNLLDMSTDELDLAIGEALLADELGAKPASDGEKRAAGRRWFENNLQRLRDAVCPNQLIRDYLLGSTNKTRNEILAAIVDALLKLGGWEPIPVVVLSAKIINYGLDRLCPQEKRESPA